MYNWRYLSFIYYKKICGNPRAKEVIVYENGKDAFEGLKSNFTMVKNYLKLYS